MRLELVVITADSTRDDITLAIKALQAKRSRMPEHWVDRRAAINDSIDDLIDRWLEAEA